MHRQAWGVHPKNIYQAMALHALLDPSIDLVILTGPAGSGKTLLAMAAALEQVVEKKMYDKIIVTRNTPDIGESIGYLPGTEEEKCCRGWRQSPIPWKCCIKTTTTPKRRSNTFRTKPTSSLNRLTSCVAARFKMPLCCWTSAKT
ncbi:PhoH family protein [Plesiomonas shigelloides]|nr:PhoH family protein [Plesiomonas shigelloides]